MRISLTRSKGITLKSILIIGGVVILLGVLVVGAVSYFGYRAVKSHVSMNPQEVEEAAKQIMSYDIPGGSRGFMAMNLGKGMKVTFIESTSDSPKITLMLASAPSDNANDADNEAALERTRPRAGENIQSTYTRKGNLCGQEINIVYKVGTKERGERTIPMSSMAASVKLGNEVKLAQVEGVGDNNENTVGAVFNSLHCNP